MAQTTIEGIDGLRRKWRAANLAPLWESPTAHKAPPKPDSAQHWRWTEIRPLIGEAMKVTSPDAVERRVLSLINAHPRTPEDEATARTITAAIQVLLPGEKARPHRHTMNALRFVLEGGGASTLVDGKDCPMSEGDLILTPGWTWHEHIHRGDKPIVWLDVLDVPLHLWLGTAKFQPGPISDNPQTLPDAAFASANFLPDIDAGGQAHSPVFRYPRADAIAAAAAAPRGRDGSRRARYANPATGGPAMPLLDSTLAQLDQGEATVPYRSNGNAVCCVVDGEGESVIGDQTIRWAPNDIFSMPQKNWISHRAASPKARLLMVSDRDALNRLGLLEEEYGNAAGAGR